MRNWDDRGKKCRGLTGPSICPLRKKKEEKNKEGGGGGKTQTFWGENQTGTSTIKLNTLTTKL
jgi:hypothetical protein